MKAARVVTSPPCEGLPKRLPLRAIPVLTVAELREAIGPEQSARMTDDEVAEAAQWMAQHVANLFGLVSA